MTGASRDTAPGAATRVDTGFGEFTVQPGDVLTFPTGLPGFEACRRFVLLSSEDLAPLQLLHAMDGAAAMGSAAPGSAAAGNTAPGNTAPGNMVSFAVIDPRLVLPSYRAVLSTVDCIRLGVQPDAAGTLLWLAIVTPGGSPEERPHVNLRAPIVINPQTMVGYQLMPSNSVYPLRHPFGGE